MNKQNLRDSLERHSKWSIKKYWEDDQQTPFEVVEWEGNLGLTVGIAEAWDLICTTGTPVAYSNAKARLGVGDSATAASSTQTGLQAPTNKLYKGMLAGYPTTTDKSAVFKSSFAAAEANFAWKEMVVDNSLTVAGVKPLVRKVSAQGTKTSGLIGPIIWRQMMQTLNIGGHPEVGNAEAWLMSGRNDYQGAAL